MYTFSLFLHFISLQNLTNFNLFLTLQKTQKMEVQNNENHSKVVTGYIIVLLFGLVLSIWGIVNLILEFNSQNLFLSLFSISFFIISLYTRRFATGNQDRIIRIEMRYRYHTLTGKRFEIIEDDLSIKQIVALRFCGDDELERIIEKTITNTLKPAEIKKLITNWQSDFQRI